MDKFRIFETEEFLRNLKKLDARDRTRVETRMNNRVYPQLREQPYVGNNIKKLHGYKPDTWRYRLGNYRVFYTVQQDACVVAILTLDDRKDAYR